MKKTVYLLILAAIFAAGCTRNVSRKPDSDSTGNGNYGYKHLIKIGEYDITVTRTDNSPLFTGTIKIDDVIHEKSGYNNVTGNYIVKESFGDFKPSFPISGYIMMKQDTLKSTFIIPTMRSDLGDALIFYNINNNDISGDWRTDAVNNIYYTGKFNALYLNKE